MRPKYWHRRRRWVHFTMFMLGVILIVLLVNLLLVQFAPQIHAIESFNTATRQQFWNTVRANQARPSTLVLVFLLITTLSAVPGFPVSAACVLIGAIYGASWGWLINLLGIAAGNLITFSVLQRWGLSRWTQKHDFRLIDRISNMRAPRVGLTIGYAVPMLPTLFVNFTAVNLKLTMREILLPMLVGTLPVAIIYAMGGHLISNGNMTIGIIVILAVCLLVVLTKRIKKREATE
ncbi:hypothetical protein AYR62_12565 [Secundilactobacillus paracollinoides]|uniref:VTT domain-containing protein n=1 Tax=Secundilactobacillus paracollinoides TaxID=240427 RepID=A0A1B2IWB8_9LACO|nr:VTT domain-containing protein [Secundilactobacillus paracollinoides]ANZ60518.1 hypothetical protein AYR61_03595 [Secundilactobacillus paracollinoides]ANZ64830.1 hypothetical protein AYR62_12565 [Secundilactobacillus paracollinoides]ANZ66345.1 hypothetical protein AYR63_03790 [Secundilactobacillus paracollinoides]KRL79687.1 hypothetical protein FC17_GL000282 [Secundilactobacillus paracollinoides DSM 15502 = JCM 11969]